MGIFSGIGRALINPISIAQLAMGPAGWASLAVRTIGMAIGKEVIQQLGQKLGLPQGMISMAQTAFSAAAGGGRPDLASVLGRAAPSSLRDAVGLVAQQFAMSPAQQGALDRTASKAVNSLLDQAVSDAKRFAAQAKENGEESGTVNAKGGFLRAIAAALGQAADSKMNEMSDLAGKIADQAGKNNDLVNSLGSKDPNGNQSAQLQNNGTQLGSLNSMFQAVSQELSILQNVISTSLKSVGEAQSTVARKG